MKELIERINNYLGNGGLFNPELMDHKKVRQLLIECRDQMSDVQEQMVEPVTFPRWLKADTEALALHLHERCRVRAASHVTIDAILLLPVLDAAISFFELKKKLETLTKEYTK